VLASLRKSDGIENPMARFGVAEKPDNDHRYHKRNLCDPHIGSPSPGPTLATFRATDGRYNDAAAKLLTLEISKQDAAGTRHLEPDGVFVRNPSFGS
jgi:hypothetical protein